MRKNEFTKILDKLSIKYCFNLHPYKDNELKFIIVGDNPGKTEYKTNEFFKGISGQELRSHFKFHKLISDFDQECIVFNKTFIHTDKTDELIIEKQKCGEALFNDILEHCAEEIAELSNRLNLPILIFGKTRLTQHELFDPFWRRLTATINKTNPILVFNHPSYNNFTNEWSKYEEKLNHENPLDLLNQIGTINADKIRSTYN